MLMRWYHHSKRHGESSLYYQDVLCYTDSNFTSFTNTILQNHPQLFDISGAPQHVNIYIYIYTYKVWIYVLSVWNFVGSNSNDDKHELIDNTSLQSPLVIWGNITWLHDQASMFWHLTIHNFPRPWNEIPQIEQNKQNLVVCYDETYRVYRVILRESPCSLLI